jgi:hypothetical protein
MLAVVCGAAVKPHAAAVLFLRRAACTTICSMLAVMNVTMVNINEASKVQHHAMAYAALCCMCLL